ncbi:MAG: iron ABC transporter permease [Acidimicrobiales bacterium]|nr:iron ABC transporter permease [Acidimicrobiales bacterium]MDP6299138.1 iron ABC transporter permease [Acidimicrobiales bacterium]HJM27569.1 iron ABC transporter permease [Acidimicrobiales bacterium]HJM98038.1 iron ABC transporter permease [Acidimicrobiales bacterium]
MNATVKKISALTTVIAFLIVSAFYTVFYFYPVGKVLNYGTGFSTVSRVFNSSATWKVIWFTTWQAIVSTFISVIVGICIANVFTKFEFRGKQVLKALAIIPFVMPTVVVATAFISVNDFLHLNGTPFSLQGSTLGIIVAHVFFNTAIVIRTVGSIWPQIDFESEMAARTLGANSCTTFFRVTLPQLKTSIFASASLAFLFTFTSFGVILLLGGLEKATLETEIWRYATQRTDFETAATLGIIQLVIIIIMLAVNTRSRSLITPAKKSAAAYNRSNYTNPRLIRLRLTSCIVFITGFLGLPFAILIERSLSASNGYSFQYYKQIFLESSERFSIFGTRRAIFNSLLWASLAMVIATILGLLAAVLMTHKSKKISRSSDIFLLLPLGTSGVLIGFGIIVGLNTSILDVRSEWWIVPVAQSILGVGFVSRIVSTAITNQDPELKQAAQTLGAGPAKVWWHIDMPIVSRSLVAGATFAFAIAIGEFGATAFLARPQRPTIPTAVFNLLGRPGAATFGQAMALSVILALITATAVSLLERTGQVVGNEI